MIEGNPSAAVCSHVKLSTALLPLHLDVLRLRKALEISGCFGVVSLLPLLQATSASRTFLIQVGAPV
jgi:hypothetical protein